MPTKETLTISDSTINGNTADRGSSEGAVSEEDFDVVAGASSNDPNAATQVIILAPSEDKVSEDDFDFVAGTSLADQVIILAPSEDKVSEDDFDVVAGASLADQVIILAPSAEERSETAPEYVVESFDEFPF